MKQSISNDAAKEFIMLLAYCDKSFIDKIPDDILNNLSSLAADSNKDFYIDETKPLMEQNFSNECKDLLSDMYFEYALDFSSKK